LLSYDLLTTVCDYIILNNASMYLQNVIVFFLIEPYILFFSISILLLLFCRKYVYQLLYEKNGFAEVNSNIQLDTDLKIILFVFSK